MEQIGLVGNRYQIIGEIGHGGMGAVYKALDRLNGDLVALKQVKLMPTQMEFATLMMVDDTDESLYLLAQEFRTLASLRHPHIVSVLDYGFDADRQAYYTMQYIDEAQDITDYAQSLALPEKVTLLIAALQALSYLHRRDIVHRDVKPANVLVNPAGVVKVLDFGLALDQNQRLTTPEQPGKLVGTLAYMAPELLRGRPATIASDLYAVGVMAYEMLTGRYPYDASSTGNLVHEIVNIYPDLSLLPSGLNAVIGRLLAKDPDDRYTTADDLIAALADAIDLPPPQEDIILRESFLKAARFVGREAELIQLQDALREMMDGRGSVWLVAGESGVGKTRLLDELRAWALISGALVLRGQGIEGGGLPFQLWRDPVRRLLLNTQLTPLDASTLKEVVPDISAILGYEVADPSPLEKAAEQERLLEAIVSLFEKQRQPILLLLEDLHWMEESLAPLRRLTEVAPQARLLVIGSYRDDEKPHLPDTLAGTHRLRLGRLRDEAIAELSEAMLGQIGRQPDVLSLLKRETEGNVYFLVETVRALAEEAGRLSNIGKGKLPDKVFAHGVQSIARRRLKMLPLDDHPALRFAAVAGRQVHLDWLQQIDDEMDYEGWLMRCANAAILTPDDAGNWSFAHDQLRQGILVDLAESERARLNALVATAIEGSAPANSDYAAMLADFWHAAGDYEKEAEHAVVFGEQSYLHSDYQAGMALLQRALEHVPKEAPVRVHLLRVTGDTFAGISDYLRAEDHYDASYQLAVRLSDASGRAWALYGQAKIAGTLGNYQLGAEYLTESLLLCEESNDQYGIARIYRNIGWMIGAQGDYLTAQRYFEKSLEICEAMGNKNGVTRSLRRLAWSLLAQGRVDIARTYLQRALMFSYQIGDKHGIASCLDLLGLAHYMTGNFADACKMLDKGLMVNLDINFQRGVARTMGLLGRVMLEQGDVKAAEAMLIESLSTRKKISYRPGSIMAMSGLSFALLAQDRVADASNLLLEALQVSSKVAAPPLLLEVLLGFARLHLLHEDYILAAEIAGRVQSHPALTVEVRRYRLEPLLRDLRHALRGNGLQSALLRGEKTPLNSLTERLLAMYTPAAAG